jgi:hypothetical protein
MKKIIETVRSFQPILKAAIKQTIKYYGSEVDRLIKSGEKNSFYIEQTLDNLLNFAYDQKVLLIFKKLCRYYYTFDQQGAIDYVKIYFDMWGEDNC